MYTYLVTIFAFTVELEVFAHLSSELVNVGRRRCEVVVQIERLQTCGHGLTKWRNLGLLSFLRLRVRLEISIRVKGWSSVVEAFQWWLGLLLDLGQTWEILRGL